MICITEDKPERLVGVSSLFLHLDNPLPEAVQYIKSLGTWQENQRANEIEVPSNQLARLLDYLSCLDDITLDVLDYPKQSIKRRMVAKHKTPPLPHQIEGIEYFLNRPCGLLLDSPGLGKTLQATYLAEELKEQEGIEHCLVICCVASLRTNWEREIAKHSNEGCLLLGGRYTKNGNLTWDGVSKRVEQLMHPIDEFFIVTNVETIRDNRIIDALRNGPNKIGMVVVDEIHKASGYSSKQGMNLLDIDAPHKIAMTGTLITKNPMSAYLPLVWAGMERKRSVTRFKSTYCELDPKTLGRILSYKNLDILKNELSQCSLRRTTEVLESDPSKRLPPIKFIDECLDMEPRQKRFYEEFDKLARGQDDSGELRNSLRRECNLVKITTGDQRALMIREIQASVCPSALTTLDVPSCKLDRAADLVEEVLDNNARAVVFSSFKAPIYEMQKRLRERGIEPLVGTGDQSDQEIGDAIARLQDPNSDWRVLLATTQKMGTGLTLTEASYVIFLDMPWNAVDYDQAWGRVHRIGCKHPVFVYNLMCQGTIDMAIARVVYRKGALSKFIVDNKDDEVVRNALGGCVSDLR